MMTMEHTFTIEVMPFVFSIARWLENRFGYIIEGLFNRLDHRPDLKKQYELFLPIISEVKVVFHFTV